MYLLFSYNMYVCMYDEVRVIDFNSVFCTETCCIWIESVVCLGCRGQRLLYSR